MKTLRQTIQLLTMLIVLCTTSCKKGAEYLTHGYDRPNAECLVTHTEDDVFGYSYDFHYNKNGDPDTMTLSGTPTVAEYDKKGRLTKVTFGNDGVSNDFLYKDNTFLPAVKKSYYPYLGGLIGIDTFHYNILGQLTKVNHINLLYPEYNCATIHQYNSSYNLTKVTVVAENGGTVFEQPLTEYEISKYDDKPNFMTGNQWMKYILMNTDMDSYLFMLNSVNNAAEWVENYRDPQNNSASLTFKATFEYNSYGFANQVFLHIFDTDGITEITTDTRRSVFTCDVPVVKKPSQRLANSIPGVSKVQHQNLTHTPFVNGPIH